ncbi:MAG: hypothetical protein U0821_08910 [Chloroflexota bacterium]
MASQDRLSRRAAFAARANASRRPATVVPRGGPPLLVIILGATVLILGLVTVAVLAWYAVATILPVLRPRQLTAVEIVDRFHAGGLPVTEVVVLTADTDPNKLLGRPGGYLEKVSWRDTRVKVKYGDIVSLSDGGSIEVFGDADGAARRRAYIEALSTAAPIFGHYAFQHGKVVLHVSKDLTPDQAAQYRAVLEEAMR